MTNEGIEKELEALENSLTATGIPRRMHRGITNYILYGIIPGDFLLGVIRNDLLRAISAADDENRGILDLYVRWFYNEAPAPCWGSYDKVVQWNKEKGLVGE